MFCRENLKNLTFPRKSLIDIHAPIKEKHVRCNQSPFMSKQLRKAIMARTRLLNENRKDYMAKYQARLYLQDSQR